MASLQTNFERLAHRNSIPDAFDKVLDTMLIGLVFQDDLQVVRDYTKKLSDFERNALKEIILEIGNQSEGFEDALGDIFMEYVSHGHNGQFFTPQPITDMMAQMIIGQPVDGQSICDPACGSGRTLLSAAKLNRNMSFHGSDLDLRCVKMTALNLALNSLVGEVSWMITLPKGTIRLLIGRDMTQNDPPVEVTQAVIDGTEL